MLQLRAAAVVSDGPATYTSVRTAARPATRPVVRLTSTTMRPRFLTLFKRLKAVLMLPHFFFVYVALD